MDQAGFITAKECYLSLQQLHCCERSSAQQQRYCHEHEAACRPLSHVAEMP